MPLVTTAAFAKDRPYESLLVIQEGISIADVEASIVSGKSRNPTSVELKIRGMSACGDKILAIEVDNVLRFYQMLIHYVLTPLPLLFCGPVAAVPCIR